MQLKAIASTPRMGTWEVLFRYVDTQDRKTGHMPTFTLPTQDYDHAKAVVNAFNEPYMGQDDL